VSLEGPVDFTQILFQVPSKKFAALLDGKLIFAFDTD
jgi:hypothetical protein